MGVDDNLTAYSSSLLCTHDIKLHWWLTSVAAFSLAAVKDALAVRRAIENLTARIIPIGRALSLGSDRLEVIEKAHGASGTRCAIAVIDTWLRGNYNPTKEPYTIAGNNPHPSWWNLVWAVCHRIGGKDPAEARIIAENHKSK